MIQSVVSTHEHLCDRGAECLAACAEGAIQIVQGKVRLAGAQEAAPCCARILHAVLEARLLVGAISPWRNVSIGIRGRIIARLRVFAG